MLPELKITKFVFCSAVRPVAVVEGEEVVVVVVVVEMLVVVV
jgi:hypothetical protein